MTERQYRDEIRKASHSLGVYRQEFSRTRVRLAKLYVLMEKLWADLDAADDPDERGDLEERFARLSDKALSCERALGLTADSLRKIREDAFAQTHEDPLAAALRVMHSG